jgi:hypothetical protein
MIENTQKSLTPLKWWQEGLGFAFFMFIFTEILVSPLISGKPITVKGILIGIPIWTIGGLFYGWVIKGIRESKRFKEKC